MFGLIGLLWGLVFTFGGCRSDAEEQVVVPPAEDVAELVPDVAPEVAECEPGADPSGCADGSLCWFGFCAPLGTSSISPGEGFIIGDVAVLADDRAGALVAFYAHRQNDSDPVTREDRVYAAFAAGEHLEAPQLVDSWTVEEDVEGAGQHIALVRGVDDEPVIVCGPSTLRAYRRTGGQWVASQTMETGAKIFGSEGSFAAASDVDGTVYAAYHDVRRESLDVATLAADGRWSVVSVVDLANVWGSRVAGASTPEGATFVHVVDGGPADRRGATVLRRGPTGWVASTPALAEGLTIIGQVMALSATTDDTGQLVLAWLSAAPRVGVAVETPSGWQMADDFVTPGVVSEDVYDALSVAWWRGTAVLAWVGYPNWECNCFDLRVAMLRGETWQMERFERYPGFEIGGLGVAVDAAGRLILSVGGGPFPPRGVEASPVYTSALPSWETP